MLIHPDDYGFTYATEGDADREYARAVGCENQDQEWILSDRDCWYRNPFYTGPKGRHPEDYDYDEEFGPHLPIVDVGDSPF
jgi:hypothetical protein